jgi:thiol:disulfide interchange protein
MKLFKIAALFLLSLSISTRTAFAGEIKPYSPAEFDKFAAEGKPILLDFRADWCATCAAQAPVIRELMAQSNELDSELVRRMGAALLGLFALVILSSSLQQRFAAATSGIGNAGNRLLSRLHLSGFYGQLVVGLVLGMIWSPCVGPTLGAAIVLASQGKHLAGSAALMGLFSVTDQILLPATFRPTDFSQRK